MFLPTIEFQLSAFGFRSFDRRLSLQCRMHAVSVLIVWIVEISAVSDLRPRGQWPQGHINADWTTCERRQAGCAPDLRQDFRAGGLGAAQFWPGNYGCRITTSVRFQEKQRYSSGVNP